MATGSSRRSSSPSRPAARCKPNGWCATRCGMPFVEFMRRRFARLYPIYLFGLLFGAAMFLATEAYPHGYGAATFAKTLALGLLVLPYLNDAVQPQGTGHATGLLFPFNGPSWSMFFELAVNVGFFALVACGVR